MYLFTPTQNIRWMTDESASIASDGTKKTDHICGNCELYQLSSVKDEPDDPLPPAPNQCIPKKHWISVGRKINGEVVISFPNQFDEDYREGIEDDYYFLAEKSFQMTNGKNPMVSHIKSFREISSYMLSLIEVACTDLSSPILCDSQLAKIDLESVSRPNTILAPEYNREGSILRLRIILV